MKKGLLAAILISLCIVGFILIKGLSPNEKTESEQIEENTLHYEEGIEETVQEEQISENTDVPEETGEVADDSDEPGDSGTVIYDEVIEIELEEGQASGGG